MTELLTDFEHCARTLRPGLSYGLVAAASLAALASCVSPPRPLFVWNSSSSSPVGLYWVTHAGRLHAGDFAIAWPPEAARNLAAVRKYLPAGVPLVKEVAASTGDAVCARNAEVLINGRAVAMRQTRDPSGRRMPWWSGCKILHESEIFLLGPNSTDSFDGRYFGFTKADQVLGRARLLWRR